MIAGPLKEVKQKLIIRSPARFELSWFIRHPGNDKYRTPPTHFSVINHAMLMHRFLCQVTQAKPKVQELTFQYRAM